MKKVFICIALFFSILIEGDIFADEFYSVSLLLLWTDKQQNFSFGEVPFQKDRDNS